MRWIRVLSAAGLLLLPVQVTRADDYRVARVSDVRGTLSVRGEQEEEASAVYANAVLRAGDTLWSDRDTLAELELENANWVRLSEDTKLEIRGLEALPEFRLWSGSVYLDFGDHGGRGCFLRTPAGDVEVAPQSVVRVDLGAANDARVSVWSGEARVVPDGGTPERLYSSDRAYLEDGRLADEPRRFDRDDRDSFDSYHRERVDYYIHRPAPRELERGLLGDRELQEYGTWIVIQNIRYWQPRCEPDWRPYSRGYWSVLPGWGYTWVDYQPWGFITGHYGRWLWLPVYGWVWYPSYAWRPAWVAWSSWDDYVGWAPLDPWDRPCDTGSVLFVALGMKVDRRSWTFCHRNRFHYGRHHWVLSDGRPPFYGAHEVRLDPARFRIVRDAAREIGIPRDHVRGVTIAKDGRLIRDRILDLEKRLPQKRLPAIRERYRTQPDADRTRSQQPGNIERYQRPPFTRVEPGQVLKGDEATRKIRRLPTPPTVPADRGRDEPFRRSLPRTSTPPRPPVPQPVRPPRPTPAFPRQPVTPRVQPSVPRTQPARPGAPSQPAPSPQRSGPRMRPR